MEEKMKWRPVEQQKMAKWFQKKLDQYRGMVLFDTPRPATFQEFLNIENTIMDKLTKENFWNELQEKYPAQYQKFSEWVNKYKIDNGWNNMFAPHINYGNVVRAENGEVSSMEMLYPKLHELPKAMQIGVFMEFASQANEIYGLDVRLLPDIDPDVELMHTYIDMPDLIRGFFYEISRKFPKTNGKRYIGVCEKSPAGNTNLGDIWEECNDGCYRCPKHDIYLNISSITHDVSNGYLKEL